MKYLYLAPLLLILFSCHKKVDLENVDETAWKKDKLGCNGYRAKTIDKVMDQQKSLMGYSQEEITISLGLADRNELLDRGQKQLIFFVEPGQQCLGVGKLGKALYLRFNALNKVYEIRIK